MHLLVGAEDLFFRQIISHDVYLAPEWFNFSFNVRIY